MTAPEPAQLRTRLAEAIRAEWSQLPDGRAPQERIAGAVLGIVQPELASREQRAARAQFAAQQASQRAEEAESALEAWDELRAQAHEEMRARFAEAIRWKWDSEMAAPDADMAADAVIDYLENEYAGQLAKVTAERDAAREQLTHVSAVAAGKIAREPAVIRVEGPALEATLTAMTVRTADERADRAEKERDQAREQLAAVRAYADDLYTAPQKVSACGVRERLLDILTPTGPARTIEEAMAGRPAPVCGDRLLDWTCALPAGPHPEWHHRTSDGNWWTQTRCPADCGQPNTEHDCAKEPTP